MELRQLRYFVRIIETGSMGRAALDLNIGLANKWRAWKMNSPFACYNGRLAA